MSKVALKADPAQEIARVEGDAANQQQVALSSPGGTSLVVPRTGLALLEEDANIDRYDLKDVAIPYIVILQALSPQVNKRDAAHVEGAEPGMFYDSSTGQIWDGEKGFHVIVVDHLRRFTEWWPRDSKQGKGLVRDFGDDEATAKALIVDPETGATANGTIIQEAGTFYSLIVSEPGAPPVRGVFSMVGTQFKKYKRLNSLASGFQIPRSSGIGVFNPAIYSRSYHFTSVPESNDKGNWYGYKIVPGMALIETKVPAIDANLFPGGEDLFMLAREFRRQVASNEVKVAAPPDAGTGGEENIPF